MPISRRPYVSFGAFGVTTRWTHSPSGSATRALRTPSMVLKTGAGNPWDAKRFVNASSSGNHIVQRRTPAASLIPPRVNVVFAPALVNLSCEDQPVPRHAADRADVAEPEHLAVELERFDAVAGEAAENVHRLLGEVRRRRSGGGRRGCLAVCGRRRKPDEQEHERD